MHPESEMSVEREDELCNYLIMSPGLHRLLALIPGVGFALLSAVVLFLFMRGSGADGPSRSCVPSRHLLSSSLVISVSVGGPSCA